MEEFGCFWSYQENLDEAREQLLYTTLELEAVKMEAHEQMRKHKAEVKQLIELVDTANKERDEARDQLQKILNKLIPCSSSYSSPASPVVIPIKANSSITESNSLSDHTHTNNHNNSSTVDSFFDAVTSPDFSDSSRINFTRKTVYDPADAAIDRIVVGKILPEKGKLLEAVTEAGPLLQTLLVAGPLPRWRNPPPLQSFKIQPVVIDQKPGVGRKSGNVDMCRPGSCSASVLSFGGSAAGGKRQRLH